LRKVVILRVDRRGYSQRVEAAARIAAQPARFKVQARNRKLVAAGGRA